MSVFNKLKKLFSHRKDVSEQIAEINQKKNEIEQKKFDQGLKKSSSVLNDSINKIVAKHHRLDDELIQNIEEALLFFDIGTNATQKILTAITEEIKYQRITNPDLIRQIIIDKLFIYYIQDTFVDTSIKLIPNKQNVILVTGVNGVGKTTSIAKLAYKYKMEHHKVCLIAGDTFRAGAVAQLEIWANKIGVPIFKPQKSGQDPASVIYGGLEYARKNMIDIVICDTSGRLQNKIHLMNELKKIQGIIKRFDDTQPIESLLVIDATTGQSGINQAKAFNEVTNITGIILTKMDSTSKGGIVLAIKDAFNLPVKFIGFGESLEDLKIFDLEMFIHGLTKEIHINE
ncbi:MAG: signal recognition particle-docking protein FtsY [Mycoplasmataceae bacterium]|jgi:fused signal recognition particle receptor|nr:signal recognition particle-docking protein FtsY [Mycoplasmataceae bacterium]